MDATGATDRPICIVDDDAGSRAVLATLLKEEGFATLTAETVEGAHDLMMNLRPAALLIDVILPDGGPVDLVTRLRDRGVHVPPLVLLSASSPNELERAQHAAGAVAALAKPFDLDTVLAVLREVLDHPQLAGSLERVLAAWPSTSPPLHELRCGVCHWLLYLGGPDYVQGIFAGQRPVQSVICPACGYVTPLDANRMPHQASDSAGANDEPD